MKVKQLLFYLVFGIAICVSFIPTIYALKKENDLLRSEREIADKSSKDCWAQNGELTTQRQQDFSKWALKTDRQVKQLIFQQSFLCGVNVGQGRVSDIPKTYEELPSCQKSVAAAVERDKAAQEKTPIASLRRK